MTKTLILRFVESESEFVIITDLSVSRQETVSWIDRTDNVSLENHITCTEARRSYSDTLTAVRPTHKLKKKGGQVLKLSLVLGAKAIHVSVNVNITELKQPFVTHEE